jgi:hypothetical protein
MPARDKTAMATTLLNLTENAALRGMLVEAEGVDEKDKWWFSVYDFINFVCDKYHNRTYAHTAFLRLTKDGSEHQNEVLSNCRHCKFPGERQRNTPCMTLRGLQRLLMILGGKVAAEYQAIAEGIFTRYTAGDASLLEEIRANAASNARLTQDGSEYQNEVCPSWAHLKFPGSCQKNTPCMTILYLIHLCLLIKVTSKSPLCHACER